MTAYVIVNVDITDPAAYDEYKALAGPAVEAHGGRYLVRGGATDVLEGDVRPGRLVLLEFPDLATARTWYDSDAYRAARAVREGAGTGSWIAVEGA